MLESKSDIVISLQMGKVASSSITTSVDRCIQLHSWSGEEPIKYFSSRYTGSLKGRVLQNILWRYRFYKAFNLVRKAKAEGRSIKILVGVREPISRNISGYFQTLTKREFGKTVEENINLFYAHCCHFAPIYWFENEIENNLGIDVYRYPFDKHKGFTLFQEDGFDFFIYKYEKLNDLEGELGQFLGMDDFSLSFVNSASDKWSSDLYKRFKDSIAFDKSYISLIYESRYVNHFYTDDEIKAYKEKWSKK